MAMVSKVSGACSLLGYDYFCMDKNGRWFAFSKRPTRFDVFWDVDASADTYEMMEIFTEIDGIPWEDSLVEAGIS